MEKRQIKIKVGKFIMAAAIFFAIGLKPAHAIVGLANGSLVTTVVGGAISAPSLGVVIAACVSYAVRNEPKDFLPCVTPVYGFFSVGVMASTSCCSDPMGPVRFFSGLALLGGVITLAESRQSGLSLDLAELPVDVALMNGISERSAETYNENIQTYRSVMQYLQSDSEGLNLLSTEFDNAFEQLVGSTESAAFMEVMTKFVRR